MAGSAAEEKTENQASGLSAPAQASAGVSKIVLALTAANMIATIGMIAIMFISFQREKKSQSVEDISVHGPASDGHEGADGDGAKDHGKSGHGAEAGGGKKHSNFGKIISLEQFTVNLSTPGSITPKFVRVNVALELPNDDSEEEVNSKTPQIRNTIIDLFNSKRPADLVTAEGRDYLKEEIRNALNAFLVNGKIKGVFFTNFALSS